MRKLSSYRLKEAIRQKYAWPGGYEILGITSDGACLCCDCMKKEWRNIVQARLPGLGNSGWNVEAIDTAANLESEEWITMPENMEGYSLSYCDHCNKILNP